MSTTDPRPLRADARRNREKIVRAAREAFAEHGVETQIDDVARRAGVGVGTLYRHFPTKEALLEALIVDRFEQLAAEARRALEQETDPWAAFAGVMWFGGELQARDRALSQVMATQMDQHRAAARRTELDAAMAELIRRAQAAGIVRADVRVDDVPLIMCGLGRVLSVEAGDVGWRRYLTLMLDGLRARDAGRLPDSD